MGYNPGISYTGDRYIAAAGSTLAADIAGFLKEREEERKQQDFNTGIAMQLARAGQLAPEDLQSFLKLSTDKQGGMLAGIARSSAEKAQQQHQQLVSQQLQNALQEFSQRGQLFPIQKHTAQTEATTAEAAAANAGKAVFAADGKTQVGVFDAKGTPHYFRGMADAGGGFTPTVYTLTDPQTGKPFSVFTRGPNQVDLTPGTANLPPSGSAAYDDQGRQIGVWNAKGTITKLTQPKPVDPLKAAIAGQISGAVPAPLQTPGAAPAAPANNGAVPVTSKAQYDALASGTLYVAPDGSVRQKP